MAVMESVTEPFSISMLFPSPFSISFSHLRVFLVKLHVFTINGSDEVCDGARFYLYAIVVSF